MSKPTALLYTLHITFLVIIIIHIRCPAGHFERVVSAFKILIASGLKTIKQFYMYIEKEGRKKNYCKDDIDSQDTQKKTEDAKQSTEMRD